MREKSADGGGGVGKRVNSEYVIENRASSLRKRAVRKIRNSRSGNKDERRNETSLAENTGRKESLRRTGRNGRRRKSVSRRNHTYVEKNHETKKLGERKSLGEVKRSK